MKPFLTLALLSLLASGIATAQPPVDYVLHCGDEPIGVVSLVDGELHAAVIAGETCEGGKLIAVVGGEELAVTVEVDDDGVVMVLVDLGEGDGMEMSAAAVVVPQEAIDGMRKAHENRAAAMERAALAREGRPELPEEATEERGERPELPAVATEERDGERPELPAAARGRRP